MPHNSEVYLGDGLYALYDGFAIWLRAPKDGGDHVVALEPAVFDALIEFVKSDPVNQMFSIINID